MEIKKIKGGLLATYQLYTFRYDISMYDEGVKMPPFRLFNAVDAKGNPASMHSEGMGGPIRVSKRRRFSKKDQEKVWRTTKGKCHLCKKKVWKLSEYGRYGWHIDHVIPNIGGGDTEHLSNMRLSCAKCNLSKGQGHTSKTIAKALNTLLDRFKLAKRNKVEGT